MADHSKPISNKAYIMFVELMCSRILGLFCIVFVLLGLKGGDDQKAQAVPAPPVTLSLEDLLGLAVRVSDRAQTIKLQSKEARGALLSAQDPMDVSVFHNLSFRDASPDFFPQSIIDSEQSGALRSGLSTQFLTGTRLEASVGAKVREKKIVDNPDKQLSFGTDLRVSVTQNLLKNSLGRSWELELEGALEQVKATDQRVTSELIELAGKVVEGFFALRISQFRYGSMVERQKKNQEILATARMLHARGNLETADLYQVENRQILSQEREREALLALENAWDQVVNELGLDEKYLEWDVRGLKLEYKKSPFHGSQKSCSEELLWQKMPSYLALQSRYRSSLKRQEKAEEEKLPSLDLTLGYELSNEEGRFSSAVSDSLQARHGQWSVVLSYRQSLGNLRAESSLLRSSVVSTRSGLELENFKGTRSSQIRQVCRKLEWLEQKNGLLQQRYTKLSERARLERQRFNIGRQDFFNATESELSKISAEHERDVLALEMAQEYWKLSLLREEVSFLESSS